MHDFATNEAVPETLHFATKDEFDTAVGKDFIHHANQVTGNDENFIVGLSHGQSPAGPYTYILEHFSELNHPERIRFTFVHSRLKRQRNLVNIMDSRQFLLELSRRGLITKESILGTTLNRESIEAYKDDMEEKLAAYLKLHNKEGLDYVFIASDPSGRVGAISRNSIAFGLKTLAAVVHDRSEKELTITPWFLMKSRRIAFLATKADKRRALAWLFYRFAKADESPSFLRHMDDVENRMTVFIDDKALTWPQIEVKRETPFGTSSIKVDMVKDFDENETRKRPVVLLVHGFLGLNTFDGLLTSIPSHKYIAAAMHYGSIPYDLPPEEYSKHNVLNIDAVVEYFGSHGHPVYIFDHSMANIYFLMIDKYFEELPGVKKYLRGRIGANPWFGEETRHALYGFLDNIILPADISFLEKASFYALRRFLPFNSKKTVRARGITLTKWMINRNQAFFDRIWNPVKRRILRVMTELDSLPHINRIPIQRALGRLPAKVFVLQTYSGMRESKQFDRQVGLKNMPKYKIPVMILQSRRDPVAKFVQRIYANSGVEVLDITNEKEDELFREHVYHMVHPKTTSRVIDAFITSAELDQVKELVELIPETVPLKQ